MTLCLAVQWGNLHILCWKRSAVLVHRRQDHGNFALDSNVAFTFKCVKNAQWNYLYFQRTKLERTCTEPLVWHNWLVIYAPQWTCASHCVMVISRCVFPKKGRGEERVKGTKRERKRKKISGNDLRRKLNLLFIIAEIQVNWD